MLEELKGKCDGVLLHDKERKRASRQAQEYLRQFSIAELAVDIIQDQRQKKKPIVAACELLTWYCTKNLQNQNE